jgi:hypothetical protein
MLHHLKENWKGTLYTYFLFKDKLNTNDEIKFREVLKSFTSQDILNIFRRSFETPDVYSYYEFNNLFLRIYHFNIDIDEVLNMINRYLRIPNKISIA